MGAGYLIGIFAICLKMRSEQFRELCHELKWSQLWVFIPGDMFFAIYDEQIDGWTVYYFVLHVAYWIAWYLHKDDGRWKRRRKRAASAVKEVAGRLVVVPVLAPAAS